MSDAIKVDDDPSERDNILDMSNSDNFIKSTQISKIPTAKLIYTSRGIFLQFMMMVTMTTFSITFINLSMVSYLMLYFLNIDI